MLMQKKKQKKKKKKKTNKKTLLKAAVRRVDQLRLALWVKISADDIDFFSYFVRKQVLTLSRFETICMKCQPVFRGKIRKKKKKKKKKNKNKKQTKQTKHHHFDVC